MNFFIFEFCSTTSPFRVSSFFAPTCCQAQSSYLGSKDENALVHQQCLKRITFDIHLGFLHSIFESNRLIQPNKTIFLRLQGARGSFSANNFQCLYNFRILRYLWLLLYQTWDEMAHLLILQILTVFF